MSNAVSAALTPRAEGYSGRSDFRTIRYDCDAVLAKIVLGEMRWLGFEPRVDGRLTPFGAVVRETGGLA